MLSLEFRDILIRADVTALRSAWPKVFPQMAAPKSDVEALIALHIARTQAQSIPLRLREYSHRWLIERNLPSLLPDELKPAAEQLRPQVVDLVGISVNSAYPDVQSAIHQAMTEVVLDAYANNDTEPDLVKRRMQEARARERKALGLPPM